MPRTLSAICIAALLLSAVTPALSAQEKPSAEVAQKNETSSTPAATAPTTAAAAEGYDAGALRMESHWGDFRVIRGATGPVVGTVGLFRSFDVEKLVAQSPVAAAEARVYQANHLPGSITAVAGILSLTAGIIMSSNSSNNASTPILIVAGAGAIGWGAVHLNAAYAALSRSLWWYNRDLKR
ncbi:MAG: hypothetical protein ABR585_08335 [Gemmatimonadaceae bacterium]